VYVAPALKAKAGPIVAALTAEREWWRSNARAVYFYEPTRDTLLRSFTAMHFRLPHPKITLIVARYLSDRSKEGQWTAAAVGFRTRKAP